jgi:predicted Zn finger-like uncharacterized protein
LDDLPAESAMLIVCPNCATSYRVIPETLGGTGRSVRCVTCHHVWFEEPRQPEPAEAAAEAEPAFPAVGPFIRPPLNDVVDIGTSPYSQPEHGEGAELGDRLDGEPDFRNADPRLDSDVAEIDSAPSIAPPAGTESHRRGFDAETNVERLAARRTFQRPKPGSRRMLTAKAAVPAVIFVLILTLASLFAARQQVVRHLPQTASLYAMVGMPVNLRGLQFENIKTVRELQDGVPVLVVEGDIVGTSSRLTEVPRLRFAVVDRAGKEIYAWTARPDRTLLPPGESLPFRSRLASPPAEANGVTVRFFNRRDATAGSM